MSDDAASAKSRKPERKAVKLNDRHVPVDKAKEQEEAAKAKAKEKEEAAAAHVKGKRLNDEELQHRRRLVLQMRLRGKLMEDIAEEMGISVAVVKRDLQEIRQENKDEFKEFDKEAFITDTMAVYDDVMNCAWREYEEAPPGSRQRLASLEAVRNAENDKLKLAQDLGLVEKEHQKLDLNISMDMLSGWTTELKQIAASRLLETMLPTKLLEPVPDENELKFEDAEIIEKSVVEVKTETISNSVVENDNTK